MEVMGTQFQGIVRERKETGGLYMDHPILILQWPFYQEKFARVTSRRSRSYRSGVTMTLAMPVSSSIDMKMNPFAVPGRCRAMMHPAVRTNSPSLQVLSSAAEKYSSQAQFRAAIVHGVSSNGEACTRIVRDQPLFRIHLL